MDSITWNIIEYTSVDGNLAGTRTIKTGFATKEAAVEYALKEYGTGHQVGEDTWISHSVQPIPPESLQQAFPEGSRIAATLPGKALIVTRFGPGFFCHLWTEDENGWQCGPLIAGAEVRAFLNTPGVFEYDSYALDARE